MPIRVNGGVFTDQVLTGSLQHFRIVGANFTGAVGPTGQPITDSAAEIIFTKIAAKATVVIMNPLTDPTGMSFALETNRADWSAEELQTMINSLGTIGVDQIDVSNVTVEQVPYDLIEQGGSGGATTFLQLTDTPASYTNAANKYVTVNPGATGLQFTVLPAIPTNSSFTFLGLSDTATPAVNNGYLKWNATGTQVTYSTTIPSTTITGLATVATSGSYNDLSNQPDLSIYAETGDLATVATTGDYTDLLNQPTIPSNGDFSFAGLDDTPNSYAGQSGKYVVVNTTADGLEFVDAVTPPVVNEVFYNNNGIITQTLSPVFSTLLFETSVETSTDVSYATGEATVEQSGWYTIVYQVGTNGTTAARSMTECKIQINNADLVGSTTYTYNRNSTDGRSSFSATVRAQLTAGDIVTVLGRGTPDPVVTLANTCRLIMTRDI